MKVEYKSAEVVGANGNSIRIGFLNSPLSVEIHDGGDSSTFPGCNLTDEGEFIPAPGFKDQNEAAKIEALQRKNKALTERQDAIVTASDHQHCIDNLPRHITDIFERMTLAEGRVSAAEAYIGETLCDSAAEKGSLFTAIKILEILR